jgi:hypothetical protein
MFIYLTALILTQLETPGALVKVKILTQAKAKDPPSNAIPQVLEQLSSSVSPECPIHAMQIMMV